MKRRKHSQLTKTTPAASAQSPRKLSGWAKMLPLVLIAAAAAAAYGNSFAGEFVLDDHVLIDQNLCIRHLWPLWRVLFPSNATFVGGRPMVSMTLAVNYAMGGTNVWGYHAVNLAIHILAAWTLYGVMRRTLTLPCLQKRFDSFAVPLAMAISLLWVIHPLQTEAVTYIIQRTEALMGLFYLLTLYCFLRGASSTRTKRWYLAATAACALGMATKEVTVTAPLVVLLYDRTFLAGSFQEAWRRRWKLYLALAATWGIVAALLISTGFHGDTTGFGVKKFTCWTYLLTQAGVIVHYLRLVFWPTGLCLDYGWPPVQTVAEIVLPGMLVVSLLGLTVWALVKRPAWGFLGACFFMILAPTSSFVPIKDAAFEHRMYLPLAAVATTVVLGGWMAGQRLVQRGTIRPLAWQAASSAAAIFAGATLAILAFQRNADYQSELSIWEDTVVKAPSNPRAHNNLGLALVACGRVNEAIAHYQKAMELKSDFTEAYNNLGNALASLGRFDEALAQYQKALEIDPHDVTAHNNLGVALAGRGRFEEALAHCQKALEIKSDVAETHNNLGNALAPLGRFDEAVAQYQKALEINPDQVEAHNNFGAALAGRGWLDDAIAHFQKALQIRPGYTDARSNLSIAESQREAIRQTLVEKRELLRARPDDLALLNDTAWMLATNPNASIRNGPEAVELAQRAVRLSNAREPAILGTLAAAYAEAGRFPEAVKTAEQALALATSQNNMALADALRVRIKLYQAGLPYRDTQQASGSKSIQP